MSPRVAAVSPARACAFSVLERVFEDGAYADRALHAAAEGLDDRERAFATALAYTAIQRSATLDHVIERLTSRDAESLDPPIRDALRLGLTQLLLLGGVADHAAVHESVELAKAHSRGGSGLVNAVLRRATREGGSIMAALDDATAEHAAILHSVPVWLARLWFEQLGAERARTLLAAVNRPAESALRVNTLRATAQAVRDRIGVPARAADDLPEGLVLEAPFDVFGSELWQEGAIMPQSRASMAVARALAPAPGQRVLDLCAAPGAKTTHLAALMDGQGELVAVERHPGRAQALERTLTRMGADGCVTVIRGDAAQLPATARGPFDRVLVDPPCSGLGTLQSRPDLRWRGSPGQIAELAELQRRIVAAGAGAVGPGGALVYSVCTISRAESDDVIEQLLAERPDFELDGAPVRTAPDRAGTDGFFIARLTRN